MEPPRRNVLFLAAFAFAGGCDGEGGRPAIAIATDATFAPFHYMTDDGATGFDIELARLTARRAGFDPVVFVKPYDDLLPGLGTGAHELVAATTGITPERERRYLFTIPYFETSQAVLVRAGDGEPAELADLADVRVGAAGDGTSARAMRSLAAAEHVHLGSAEAAEDIIAEGGGGVAVLEAGIIDALIVDEFDAVRAARDSDGRLRVLAEPAALERYAFVLPLPREDLKRRLDEALDQLRAEGVVDSLRAAFGVARDSDWPVRSP